jgi:hypothetical protein
MDHHNLSDDDAHRLSALHVPGTTEPLLSGHTAVPQSVSLVGDAPFTAMEASRSSKVSSIERVARKKPFWLSNPADPTSYDLPPGSIKEDGQRSTVREYSRSRQRTRILLNSTTRVLFTIILCALCAVVLRIYQMKRFLTVQDVQWLTTIMTTLPLLVGLNYRSSLHSYAKVLRWRVLVSWEWPLRQFDLILDAAESQALLRLIWHARRSKLAFIPTATQVASVLWLIINVAGGVGIALLSLTYSLDTSGELAWRHGDASILDTSASTFFNNAYQYGVYSSPAITTSDGASAERKGFRGLVESTSLWKETQCSGCQAWNYTLTLKNPLTDVALPGSRSFFAAATCDVRPVMSRNGSSVTWVASTTQGELASNLTYFSRTFDSEDIGWAGDLSNSTLYVNKGRISDRECIASHGVTLDNSNDWCSGVEVLIVRGAYADGDPELFYNCTSSVSGPFETLSNSTQVLADDVKLYSINAHKLAAAIAHPNVTEPDRDPFSGSALYEGVDAWTLNHTDKLSYDDLARRAANSIAQFSMTALAAADQGIDFLPEHIPRGDDLRIITRQNSRSNQKFNRVGSQPYTPSVLKVKWIYAIAILCAVPGLQLVVLLTIIFFADSTVVKDDSHVCIARLLAPVVSKGDGGGSLLSVDEVVEDLGDGGMRFRYGWEQNGEIKRVLIFEDEKGGKGRLRAFDSRVKKHLRRFPEGKYD